MSDHAPSVKAKILAFVVSSQKALAAFIGSASALASANLVPAPYGSYLATALVVATGLATYFLPYIEQVVRTGNFATDIPVSEIVAEHEADQAAQVPDAAPESPADAADSPAPTEDTPAVDPAPETRPMAIDELLDALHGDRTGQFPAVQQ